VFLQQLALLAGFDLPAAGHLSADYVHTVIECAKLAFADREAWYGDPDEVDVPLAGLLSTGYNDARRATIGSQASLELRPGSPGGRAPQLTSYDYQPSEGVGDGSIDNLVSGTGEPTVSPDGTTRGDTCQLDVVDRFGMMISATPSGGWLQSSPTVPGLGFCLNSRAQMAWLEPGLASSLRPGGRPRITLSPSMVLREGRPYLAFGTPGGDQQDQWSLLFFLAHAHFGLDLQAAIDAPEWHTDHLISSFYPRQVALRSLAVEARFEDTVIADLRRRGHDVTVAPPWSLGRVSAVQLADGQIRAAANPRGMQGYAIAR
jgi:gamma-glutamyltranspeptidase/glutathione hydrolase